jgi:HK97 gp10 family phage protein
VSFDVDVSELTRLAKDLADAPDQKQREARAATQRIAQQVQSRARAAVPRDTGGTARGIRRRTWANRNDVHVDVYTTRDERGYNVGFYLEYGTSKMPPRPFLAIQAAWAASALVEALAAVVDPFDEGETREVGDD